MNEPELAKLYHDRMLLGFQEPALSNAVLRSKEILRYEEKIFSDYYLIRPESLIDQYRAVDMILSLEASPIDEHLTVERDLQGNPLVFNFIELILHNQKELVDEKKKFTFIKGSLVDRYDMISNKNSETLEPHPVSFTNYGRHRLLDNNPFIQKISANLIALGLKTSQRVSHKRDVNIVMNFLNYAHEDKSVKIDYEQPKTRALKNGRKFAYQEIMLFLTKIRYYIVKLAHDMGDKKAAKYNAMLRSNKVIAASENQLKETTSRR